jgi:hypothetical protein
LESTAIASAAHATSIQRRHCAGDAAALCASTKAPNPSVIQKVSPMSSVRMWALATYHRQPPSAAPLKSAMRGPPRHPPTYAMNSTPRKPESAGHSRAVQGCTPNASYAAAVIQY